MNNSLPILLALSLSAGWGCAAMRPLEGIPVAELPNSLRAPSRSAKTMIDLSLLRQTPPKEHRVDAEDVLGVYIESILGGRQQVPPVNFRQNSNGVSSLGYPIRVRADGTISLPGISPIPVRGMTIGQVENAVRTAYTTGAKPPLVKGTERIIVNLQRPRHFRVLVIRQEIGNTNTPSGNDGQVGSSTFYNNSNNNGKFGMGRTVNLPAYKNDVLHALAETGGLPGLDAENVIYVIRRRARNGNVFPPPAPKQVAPYRPPQPGPRIDRFPPARNPRRVSRQRQIPVIQPNGPVIQQQRSQPVIRNFDPIPQIRSERDVNSIIRGQSPAADAPCTGFSRFGGHSAPPNSTRIAPATRIAVRTASTTAGTIVPVTGFADTSISNPHVVRIPLRIFSGQAVSFSEEDITLQDGDVVLIEARDSDVFYTGGLLGGGRYLLPRDRDLNVIEALAMAQSSQTRNLPTRAIGGASTLNQDVTAGASDLIILRPCGDGCRQVAIRINLYSAIRNPRERINVRPGDHLVLQYTRTEAIAAFIERHILDPLIIGASSGVFFRN